MALTVAELGAALRLTTDPASPPAEPLLGILHRQLRAAENQVNRYAPAAPEENREEAVIRTVGYYFERPDSSNPFVLSGARSLLYDWHELVTAKVQPATTPAVVTPETGLNPSHPVHTGTHFRYAGWSDDGTIDQAELDAAAQFTGDALLVPNRATAGYIFFGVDEDPGYPDSIFLDGNPTNQIQAYLEQAARLIRETNTVIIGVIGSSQSPLLSGRTLTLGYVSP